jgi:hypothetical protein
VVTYDLLSKFYIAELAVLKGTKVSCPEPQKKSIDSNLTWTASKTDLVELIYALRAARAI